MRIVDAQIHLWGSGLPSNMAHRQVTSFTTEEAVGLMDEGGVDAAVIHPPGWHPNSTEMAFKAVRDFPGRFAILGAFPLSQPDKRALVETWRSQPGMLGLRYAFLHEPMRGWLADGTLAWFWAAAEKAQNPVAMLCAGLPCRCRPHCRAPSRPALDRRSSRRPGRLRDAQGRTAMTHIPALVKLARHPNVAIKATGAPGYASGAYPYASMHTYLRQVFDAFGPERMFWGTDISKLPCSWKQCVTMFTEELPWLSERDKELVMGQAVCAWWGWN